MTARAQIIGMWAAVVSSTVWLCGCGTIAYVQYPPRAVDSPTHPGRPLVALAKFRDERPDRTVFGKIGLIQLRTKLDIGKAFQEELALALRTAGYNVVVLEQESHGIESLRTMLESNQADVAMGGTLQNLWAETGDALVAPARIDGRASIAVVKRGRGREHEWSIHATDRQRVGVVGLKPAASNAALMFGLSDEHPAFNVLFQHALAHLASAIVEDPEVKRELSGASE